MLGASLCLKKRSYPTTAMTPEIYTILAGIRIRIDNQTINGRVYDLLASHQGDGVWRIDRVAGSTEVPTGGGTETGGDSSPALGSGPGNRTYTVGTAIDTLTLPAASGGDGTLTYSLAPSVPGLTFNASTRQLTGTPTMAASYNITYTVTDEDGDTDTLGFTITVQDVDNGDPVMIPDAVLRSAIEAQLGKAQGAPIYKIEMQSLEIMHRWANFVVPSSYGGHWGFSSANGALGGFDIAEHGARVPDSRTAQREFRAVVVLLVNEENPATRELLDVVSRDVDWFGHGGIDEFPSIFNFYEATGGRATITVDGLDQLALDNG